MQAREPAARLDSSVGRGAPRRPAPRARRTRPRRKPLAAAALVGALAGALLVVGRHHTSSALPLRPDPATMSTASTEPAPPDTSALRALLEPDAACLDRPAPVPSVSCTIGRVTLDAQLVDAAAAPALYASRSGARIAARRGAPACARGLADERSWSRPPEPEVAVGRYRCRIESGKAAIWWFDEHGLVAHVLAPNGNLTSLFAWWVSHVDQ